MTELLLQFPSDQATDLRCYPITYYPFRYKELLRYLKEAGFQKVKSDFDETKDWYTIAASGG